MNIFGIFILQKHAMNNNLGFPKLAALDMVGLRIIKKKILLTQETL